jgi:hypothetical protein
MLNEWNYGLIDPGPPDMTRAAFVASSTLYMQDAPIDVLALYRADNVFGPNGMTPHKTGYALIAMGRMQDTPVRLKTSGGDEDGLVVQAGRTKNGDTVQVLISNYQIDAGLLGPRKGPNALTVGNEFSVALLERRSAEYQKNGGYDLSLQNLASGRKYRVERYRIAAQNDLSLVDTSIGTGPTIHLVGTLPPPGIELVVLKKQ